MLKSVEIKIIFIEYLQLSSGVRVFVVRKGLSKGFSSGDTIIYFNKAGGLCRMLRVEGSLR